MTRRSQKLIAMGLIVTGAATGLWVGVSFIHAQAQDGGVPVDGAQPPPQLGNEPPPMGAEPPAMGTEPPAMGTEPPAMGETPPPPEDFVPSESEIPPEQATGGPQDLVSPPIEGARPNLDGFIYNPEGLRDPFFPSRGMLPETPVAPIKPGDIKPREEDFDPKDPLQAYELREYRLVAVLWDVRQPKAMVATPDGKVWTIRQKVRLGRAGAVVAAIRESEIVVVEPNPDGSYLNAATRVISIKK